MVKEEEKKEGEASNNLALELLRDANKGLEKRVSKLEDSLEQVITFLNSLQKVEEKPTPIQEATQAVPIEKKGILKRLW